MKVKITIINDDGNILEGETILVESKAKSKLKKEINVVKTKTWYQPTSTVAKLVALIDDGFFDINRTLNDIIKELKTKDYHFKAADLTLPLRKIVRRGILKKTKKLPNNKESKVWTYIKA